MTGQATLLALQTDPILLGEGLFLEVVIVVGGLHRFLEIQPTRPEGNRSIDIIGVSEEIEFVDVAGVLSGTTPRAPTSGTAFADLRGSGLSLLGNDLVGLFVGRGGSRLSGFGAVLHPSGLAATSPPTPPAAAAARGSL